VPTQCIPQRVEYQGLSRRRIVGNFQGGLITSDAGALLLREVEHRSGILRRVSACFTDTRDVGRIEHPVKDLLAQRIYGLALGYEDLNDHDRLRRDPLWGTLIGKPDPAGDSRKRARDRGCSLAGKSTLNRLEHTPKKKNGRYHKITWDEAAMANVFVDHYLDATREAPEEIVLDLDATDDLIHGTQEGRFFHGYYGGYCYLPLYIFAGRHLLCAKLRRSNIDGAAGALEEVERIVERLRARWPEVAITLRADSGFARDAIMTWCEANGVDYVLGLSRNKRLVALIQQELDEVESAATRSGQSTRQFKDLRYRTLKSWSCARRVVDKAEYLPGGERPRANPRFVVTTLTGIAAAPLYEDIYCARGEMENRIKEQQLDLFADRTSSATMRANQLRLWFSSLAHVFIEDLRRLGLAATKLARARAMTIRLKLFKIGAQVRVSVRRVAIMMSSGYPDAELFTQVVANLQRPPPG
jgi:Transposase DDE domain group 1